MRFAVLIACVVAVASAAFPVIPSGQYVGKSGQYKPFSKPTYKPFVAPTPEIYRPTAVVGIPPPPIKLAQAPISAPRVSADARSADTLKFGNEIEADGTYNYFYETNNGIAAQAQGVPRVFSGNPPLAPVVAQGTFSWISPEGIPIDIKYVADENGYQPQGSALPTPPEVPAQIARALAYTAKYISNARK